MSHQQSQVDPLAEHFPLVHVTSQLKRFESALEAPTIDAGIIVAKPATTRHAARVVEMRIASSLGEVEAIQQTTLRKVVNRATGLRGTQGSPSMPCYESRAARERLHELQVEHLYASGRVR